MRLQVCLAESLAIGSWANCRLADVVTYMIAGGGQSEAVPAVLLPISFNYQTVFFATAYL